MTLTSTYGKIIVIFFVFHANESLLALIDVLKRIPIPELSTHPGVSPVETT